MIKITVFCTNYRTLVVNNSFARNGLKKNIENMLLSQIVGIYSWDLATSFYNLWAFFEKTRNLTKYFIFSKASKFPLLFLKCPNKIEVMIIAVKLRFLYSGLYQVH